MQSADVQSYVSQDAKGVKKPLTSREIKKRSEETTLGDPRYLQGIQWCIQERCKILGLYAPVTSNVNIKNWRDEASDMGIDPDALMSELVSKYVDANEVKDAPESGSDGDDMVIEDEGV